MSEFFQLPTDNVACILNGILMKLANNQNILKCLYYTSTDVLTNNKLSVPSDEVFKMLGIVKTTEPQDRKFYPYPFANSVTDTNKSEIRVFLKRCNPDNIFLTSMQFIFQIIVANDLWELDHGVLRPLAIMHEILKELNGQEVEGIGVMNFDIKDYRYPIEIIQWNDSFTGYSMIAETRMV